MRVALTALTMAEYFRDINKQDVLFFVRPVPFISEISFAKEGGSF